MHTVRDKEGTSLLGVVCIILFDHTIDCVHQFYSMMYMMQSKLQRNPEPVKEGVTNMCEKKTAPQAQEAVVERDHVKMIVNTNFTASPFEITYQYSERQSRLRRGAVKHFYWELKESLKRLCKRDPVVFWCAVIMLVTNILRVILLFA